MLSRGGSKILPVIPQLIIPIKSMDFVKSEPQHQGPGRDCGLIEGVAKTCDERRYDRRGSGSLLPADLAHPEPLQEHE